jgi:hypothetical protein
MNILEIIRDLRNSDLETAELAQISKSLGRQAVLAVGDFKQDPDILDLHDATKFCMATLLPDIMANPPEVAADLLASASFWTLIGLLHDAGMLKIGETAEENEILAGLFKGFPPEGETP